MNVLTILAIVAYLIQAIVVYEHIKKLEKRPKVVIKEVKTSYGDGCHYDAKNHKLIGVIDDRKHSFLHCRMKVDKTGKKINSSMHRTP